MVAFACYSPDNAQVMFLPPDLVLFVDVTVFPNVEVETDLESAITRGTRVGVAERLHGGHQGAYRRIVGRLGLTWVPEYFFDENP